MKKDIRHIAVSIIVFVLLGSGSVYAQTFVIPDPNFKSFLKDTFPSVLDVNDDLILANAAGINVNFNASNRNISNVDGIQYFTSLSKIYLSNNKLSTLPNLNSITGLRELEVDNNLLDSLPPLMSLSQLRILKCFSNKLTKLPPMTGMTNLYRVFCQENQLTELPDLSGCTDLYHLLCRKNNIDSLPDFATNTALGIFECTYNPLQHVHDYSFLSPTLIFRCSFDQLTFEDLWLLARHPGFDTNFAYSPQDSIPVNDIIVSEFDTLKIHLAFDDTVTKNFYAWYKNGIHISTNPTNRLQVLPVDIRDGDEYYCKIMNYGRPSWTSFELVTEKFKVLVAPCMNVNYLNYTTVENDCKNGTTVDLNDFAIINGTPPYQYKLFNTVSTDTTVYNSKRLTDIKAGVYDLIVNDNNACAKTIRNFISIKENASCDLVITPDGDGKKDEYFIDTPGTVKIYDVNGVLVKNIQAPGYWDGTNNRGELVPMGLYAIIVEDKNIANVTVVY